MLYELYLDLKKSIKLLYWPESGAGGRGLLCPMRIEGDRGPRGLCFMRKYYGFDGMKDKQFGTNHSQFTPIPFKTLSIKHI